MALHSMQALDYVVKEYRDYLRTEFRAKGPALRASLERPWMNRSSWPRSRSLKRTGPSAAADRGALTRLTPCWQR
jgi:hypothetical protein